MRVFTTLELEAGIQEVRVEDLKQRTRGHKPKPDI
jgi:hypothetical protein